MSWLLREKTDGRRTAGYLAYLLGGLAAAAGMLIVHHRTADVDGAASRPLRGKPSNMAPITQPAAIMSPIEVAARPAASAARSYRMEKQHAVRSPSSVPGDDSSPGSFNAIDAALEEAPAPDSRAPGAGGPAGPAYAELPPAFPMEAARRGQGQGANPPAQLLGYRDPAADAAPGGPAHAPRDPRAAIPAYFVPRGTLIHVYLLTTVDTGNPSAVLQFGAAGNLVFNHRCQLQFGTRFLGRLSGHPVRDRVNLTAEMILYPDGLEVPMSASAVEADETGISIHPGVAAYFYPPPDWVQMAPYFSDFFTGAMGLLGSRAQQQFAIGVGGVSVETNANGDLRAPLYQASAQAVQDFTQARLKEIEQRYASFYLVPAGTPCWLQLDADLNLEPAHAFRKEKPNNAED